jgi:hypothetical protein
LDHLLSKDFCLPRRHLAHEPLGSEGLVGSGPAGSLALASPEGSFFTQRFRPPGLQAAKPPVKGSLCKRPFCRRSLNASPGDRPIFLPSDRGMRHVKSVPHPLASGQNRGRRPSCKVAGFNSLFFLNMVVYTRRYVIEPPRKGNCANLLGRKVPRGKRGFLVASGFGTFSTKWTL